MRVAKRITGLIYLTALSMIFMFIAAPADEIGVATGLNISACDAEDPTIDFPNPIEITFQKNLFKSLGIYSGLQYSKRSNSVLVYVISSTDQSTIEYSGEFSYTYRNELNYLSLEISPILSFRLNNIEITGRLGLSGDFYINEWTKELTGDTEVSSKKIRNEERSPFVLSFAGGFGFGYIIKNRFKIGLRSSISRNLTAISKYQFPYVEINYLNFHNVLCFGYLF